MNRNSVVARFARSKGLRPGWWALPLVFLLAVTAVAEEIESESEACVRTKVWEGYSDGWSIRTLTSASLASGATRNYLVTLYKGNEYKLLTCADEGMKNLDVLLYDMNGNVVARDDSTDREPILLYKPDQTTTYYIVVYARELAEGKAESNAAVAVTYR